MTDQVYKINCMCKYVPLEMNDVTFEYCSKWGYEQVQMCPIVQCIFKLVVLV